MPFSFPASRLAWIAIGTNQGHRRALYEQAVRRLSHPPMQLRLVARSSLYLTEPVGPVRQPWFLNGVVVVESPWGPKALLKRLHRVEHALGRRRSREKNWGPRRIDLDLLLHGDRIVHSPTLHLPHPHLHRRRFVLTPLVEVSPGLIHPVFGKTVDKLLQDVDDTATVKRLSTCFR